MSNKRFIYKKIRLLFCFVFTPLFLPAQQQTVWFEHLGMDHGLSNLSVLSLCRDSRGFLWIGTAGGGLNRYDGHEMKVYRRRENDSLSLCDDHINNILEDDQGFLWMGTNNGVCRMNPVNGRCDQFTHKNGRLRGGYGSLVYKDRSGKIWMGNHGSLAWFDADKARFILHPAIDPTEVLSHSAFDSTGRFWIGTLKGVRLIEPFADTAKRIPGFLNKLSKQRPDIDASSIQIDRSDNIWIKTWGNGLQRYNPVKKQLERFLWNPKPKYPTMENIPGALAETFDRSGGRSFWIAAGGGLFKFPLAAPDFPSLQKPHVFFNGQSGVGLPDDHFNTLLTDRQGNLWLGTATNGVYRYHTRQENFQSIKKVKSGSLSQLCFAKNGDVLVCGLEDPLVILDVQLRKKKVFRRFFAQMDPVEGLTSWEAAKDEESGIVYITTFDGLVAYDEKKETLRWYRHNPADSSGLLWRKLTNVLPVGGDRLLIGFWKRPLQLLDARTGKSIRVFGKHNMIVRRINKTPDGAVWACTENGLYRFDPETTELTRVHYLEHCRYWDVHLDKAGRTWIGTDKGLFLFDRQSGRVTAKFGVEQGLPGNNITRICEDALGRLWLMTELGLCFFDPGTQACHSISQSDGLLFKKTECLMSQSPDGRIWVAYEDLIQIFTPEFVETPKPSKVHITSLKINETDTFPEVPFEQIPEIRLHPGQNALTFSYTAIDLESFGKTNFLYRLEGLQNDWVNAGKTRNAAFVNLPAGVYTFRVRPEDAGAGDACDAVLRVRVTDFFWQRAWFRAMILVLLSALTVFAYNRWTNQRLRLRLADFERERALEELRLDIAQDIHDEVGSELTKISLSAQFSAMLTELKEADLREKLRHIGSDAQSVARQLGEIVFAINPRYDRFSEVQAYFREKGREFLEEAQISSKFDLPPDPGNTAVPPHIKRQLYMLYRECLNNIVKHAGARSVAVVFRREEEPGEYLLEIRDDGKGFDPENTRQFGNGLKGMRARTEKIDANLEIETAEGKGTMVRVRGTL